MNVNAAVSVMIDRIIAQKLLIGALISQLDESAIQSMRRYIGTAEDVLVHEIGPDATRAMKNGRDEALREIDAHLEAHAEMRNHPKKK